MALTLVTPYSRGELGKIDPRLILFDEAKNGRGFPYVPEDYKDLTQDLRDGVGINVPIQCSVVKKTDGQYLDCVAGFRRMRAALDFVKEVPEYQIKFIITKVESEYDSLIQNVRENAGRNDLGIIDQGRSALRLQELPTETGGLSLDQIASLMRVSPAQVSFAIKVVSECPEVIQRLLAKKGCSIDSVSLALRADGKTRSEIFDAILKGKATIAVVPASGEEEEDGKSPKKEKTLRDAARDSGAKVARKVKEINTYYQEAIEEDGPGSNKGEVQLKKKLIEFNSGKISSRTMDEWFNKCCLHGGPK